MHTRATPKSILIVGGGVIALACAFRLIREGIEVTVVSPGDPAAKPASWGNAGHIATEQAEPLASPKALRQAARNILTGGGTISALPRDIRVWAPFLLRMIRASTPSRFRAGTTALTACMNQALPAWRELLAGIDGSQLLIDKGHFVAWESRRRARVGLARWNGTNIGPASFRPATDSELARLQALVRRRISFAIRFEGSGHIAAPGDLLSALAAAVAAAGGDFISAHATGLSSDRGGRVSVTTGTGESLSAEAVLIASGVDSGRLLHGLGHAVPIIAERGYHIESDPGGWPADLPPVVFEDRAIIVTRFTRTLRVCSFVEFARSDRPPTHGKWWQLERHAAELGLPLRSPARWMGARPTLPDYLPAIGKSRRAANLFYAFGHQHLGLTLAAITAAAVADLVRVRQPAIPLEPFDIDRFTG